MKISCPQCNMDCELPNPAQAGEQKPLQCKNCLFQINSDNTENMLPTKPHKPARRIIVLPSTKPKASRQSSELARPDLLKKAKMLVATKHDLESTKSSNGPQNALDDHNQAHLEPEIDADLSLPEQAISPQLNPEFLHDKPTFRQKWLNIAAVIGALLIFGGGLAVRDQVVSVIPSFAQLSRFIGIDVKIPGLEFASVTSKTIAQNGGNILIVEGIIRNITNKTVKVPAVRLLMRAADKQELYSWFHEPKQTQLQAGDTMVFTTQLFGPPADVKDIHLKFTERQKQQAKLGPVDE